MPSAMAKLSVRIWSAMTRKAISVDSCSVMVGEVGWRQGAAVLFAAQDLDLIKDRSEDIRLVVRNFRVGKSVNPFVP